MQYTVKQLTFPIFYHRFWWNNKPLPRKAVTDFMGLTSADLPRGRVDWNLIPNAVTLSNWNPRVRNK